MSLAVDTEKCMFFVGGNKAKSLNPTGSSYAGGCTKAWWDAAVAADDAETAMGKLMGADGESIVTVAGVTAYEIPGGEFAGKAVVDGDFSGVEAGMITHCSSGLLGDSGLYKVLETDGSYCIFDHDFIFTGVSGTVSVGGAWNDPRTLCLSYLDAVEYTQEVFINKNLAPTSQWNLSSWGHGELSNSTFLVLHGFHRTPGDITNPDGAYYQTILDAKKNGRDSDCWVDVDLSGVSSDYPIDPDASENIIWQGFRLHSHSQFTYRTSATNSFFNHILRHNIFDGEFDITLGANSLTLIDNYLVSSGITLTCGSYDFLRLLDNIIESTATFAANLPGVDVAAFGNLIIGGDGKTAFLVQKDGRAFAVHNTLVGGTINGVISFGGEASAPSEVVSVNNILLPAVQTTPGYHQADHVDWNYGSLYADNDCVYVPGVGVVDALGLDEYKNKPAFTGSGILEVDPLLDSDNEPLENDVRTGGTLDILGDAKSIGAVQTMNTTVINSAVQAAMTSQGYTTARAPYIDAIKAKTDNLPADPVGVSDLADVDTSACKLAADGLDNVVVAEPTGEPSTWSFVKCLRWLIMRFMNKHTSDNYTGIKVHKSDGTVSTEQAVTEVSGVKSVGKVTL